MYFINKFNFKILFKLQKYVKNISNYKIFLNLFFSLLQQFKNQISSQNVLQLQSEVQKFV